MISTRHTFQKIVVNAVRSGKCEKCGKRWRKQKKFWHSVNPFNKNEDGSQKSPKQVHADVVDEANAWQPVHCE